MVRVTWQRIIACLCLALGACSGTVDRAPPRVTDGVLDARSWNFDADGAIPLQGEWEALPATVLEGPAIVDGAASGDLVRVPWSEAHHPTAHGVDLDAAPFTALRVRIRVMDPSAGYALEFTDWVAESFHVTCRDESGAESTLAAGIASAHTAAHFEEGLVPRGTVSLARSGACVVTVPRGARDRTVLLSVPRLVRAQQSARTFARDVSIATLNFGILLTFAVFSAIMTVVDRRDRVPRWSLALAVLMLLRVVSVNRGLFLEPSALVRWKALLAFRLEYTGLWLLGLAFVRYAESVTEEPVPLRRLFLGGFSTLAIAGTVGSFAWNERLLPVGQALLLTALVVACRLLYGKRHERASRLTLLGIATVGVGATGSIVSMVRFGSTSPIAELISSAEPFFQMAVLAVRASDARRKATALARATQQFVPRQFLHELGHEDVTTAKLGDAASRHATMLFADIRRFTSISENMSPAETFAFLNECLSRMGPHVRDHHGFVDKYIGDAIMALFPREPSDAVRAAVAMQSAIATPVHGPSGDVTISLGVGIHVGDVMMGTIGERERFEATVISDAVNLTARLESLTKQLGCTILVSEDVHAALDDDLRACTRRLGNFVVKGKAKPVALYEVFASDSAPLATIKRQTLPRFEAMLAHFVENRIEEALGIATELRDGCADDGPANWWLMRLTRIAMGTEDAPPSSHGVVVLDEK